MKDRGERNHCKNAQGQGHIVLPFQYFSVLSWKMSSYIKDIKQMVWWCVWYIIVILFHTLYPMCQNLFIIIITFPLSHAISALSSQRCWVLLDYIYFRLTLVCNESLVIIENVCWQYLVIVSCDFGWIVSPPYSIKINFLYLNFHLLLSVVLAKVSFIIIIIFQTCWMIIYHSSR